MEQWCRQAMPKPRESQHAFKKLAAMINGGEGTAELDWEENWKSPAQ